MVICARFRLLFFRISVLLGQNRNLELSQGLTLIYLTYFDLLYYYFAYILFTLLFLCELFIFNKSIKHCP